MLFPPRPLLAFSGVNDNSALPSRHRAAADPPSPHPPEGLTRPSSQTLLRPPHPSVSLSPPQGWHEPRAGVQVCTRPGRPPPSSLPLVPAPSGVSTPRGCLRALEDAPCRRMSASLAVPHLMAPDSVPCWALGRGSECGLGSGAPFLVCTARPLSRVGKNPRCPGYESPVLSPFPPQCVALAPLVTDLSFQVSSSHFELLSPPLFFELGVFPLNWFGETSCFLNSLDLMEKTSSCLPLHLPPSVTPLAPPAFSPQCCAGHPLAAVSPWTGEGAAPARVGARPECGGSAEGASSALMAAAPLTC